MGDKMQFSVSGSERQACVTLMRGNTVKSSLSALLVGEKRTVVTQFLSVNTLITGLLEGHVFFFTKIEEEEPEWVLGYAELSPIGLAHLSNSAPAPALAPPWCLCPVDMHS